MTVAAAHRQHDSRWLIAILAFVLGGIAVGLLYHPGLLGGPSSHTEEGSGLAATQVRHVGAFSAVELAGANNVVIHVGKSRSVVVRADDNLLDRVTTRVESGRLVVGNTPGSFESRTPMRVDVTVPVLDAVTLAGAGNIVFGGVDAPNLKLRLSGAGMLTGSGTATRLDVGVGGSGTVLLTRLVASDVRAVVSGSGTIFVTATDSLAASVSGTGSILYGGKPRHVTKTVTGTGSVTGS